MALFQMQGLEDISDSIFWNLRRKEGNGTVNLLLDYVEQRKQLMIFLIQIGDRFGFSNFTTFHAAHLLDRVCSFQLFRQFSFKFVALGCFVIAVKFGERDDEPDRIANILRTVGVDVELYKKVEISILQLLNWNVICVTPLCFFRYLFAKTPATKDDEEINHTVILLLGLALQDHHFLQYLPSVLCASAILCARAIVNRTAHSSVQVEPALQFNPREIEACQRDLFSAFNVFTQDRIHSSTKNDQDCEMSSTQETIIPPSPTSCSES